tara:strand:- start:880 stop:1323 length:444 start_codon:yes stop_codon:yes gene_type:complete
MLKTIYRIVLYFFSKFIKTDEIADKFPISLKILIIDNNRVLFLKNERNEWDLPGGKINFNENPIFCLKREVFEETKLKLSNIELIDFLNLNFDNIPVCIVLYKSSINSDNPVEISFEHSEFNFFDKNQIKNINCPSEYKEVISNLIF